MTLKTAIDNKPKGTKFIFNTPVYNYDSGFNPCGNRIMYTTLDKCIMTIIDNTYNARLENGCIWNARGTNKPSFASVDTSTSKVKVRYEEAK